MKSCRDFQELLSASLDGAVSAAENASLEAHLAQCPECRVALEELRWTAGQIRKLEPVEPPPWLKARIMARLHSEEAPARSTWRKHFLPVLLSPQFRVATLVFVGAMGTYIVSRSPDILREEPLPARSAAQVEQKGSQPATTVPSAPSAASLPEPEAPAPPAQRKDARARKDDAPFAPPPPTRPHLQEGEAKKKGGGLAEGSGGGAYDGASRLSEPSVAPAPIAPPPSMKDAPREAQMAPSAVGSVQRKQAAKSERGNLAAASLFVIRIEPHDPSGFAGECERELLRAGAEIVPPRGQSGENALTARLESHRLPVLLERLSRLGVVRERPEEVEALPSTITITLRW